MKKLSVNVPEYDPERSGITLDYFDEGSQYGMKHGRFTVKEPDPIQIPSGQVRKGRFTIRDSPRDSPPKTPQKRGRFTVKESSPVQIPKTPEKRGRFTVKSPSNMGMNRVTPKRLTDYNPDDCQDHKYDIIDLIIGGLINYNDKKKLLGILKIKDNTITVGDLRNELSKYSCRFLIEQIVNQIDELESYRDPKLNAFISDANTVGNNRLTNHYNLGYKYVYTNRKRPEFGKYRTKAGCPVNTNHDRKDRYKCGAVVVDNSLQYVLLVHAYAPLEHKKIWKWGYPKGSMKQGEYKYECVNRELCEEVGINLNEHNYTRHNLVDNSKGYMDLIVLDTSIHDTRIVPDFNTEINAYRWEKIDDLRDCGKNCHYIGALSGIHKNPYITHNVSNNFNKNYINTFRAFHNKIRELRQNQ